MASPPDPVSAGHPWIARPLVGFGTPEQTNAHLKSLLAQGQTAFALAFDFSTSMGYDSDSPRALGEVGMSGVAVDTLRDLDVLFNDIPLDQVSPAFAVNGPAIVLLGFYVALADARGVPRERLAGATQNDGLQEAMAQQAWVAPPRHAVRLAADVIEFCSRQMPRWDAVSICGYALREAGATAAHELAFSLATGLAYVEACLARGLAVDLVAPRLSFFFDVHRDFFEEIAKFRAARRLWARLLRDRHQASLPASLALRAHARTSAASLTAQQPRNNDARVALQALAAVLGGVQSLHTSSLAEVYALPSASDASFALRTQQILAEESGVASAPDPLAGSHHVERLTDQLEAQALDALRRIDELGGLLAAVEQGHPQREIAAASYRAQRQVELHERVVVGVNRHRQPDEEKNIPTLPIDEQLQALHADHLRQVRASRDAARVASSLDRVRSAALGNDNLVEPIVEAAKALCTEQEVCDTLRSVFGSYEGVEAR